MSKIKLTGESSGYVEISAGSNAGNNTLELPTSGTRLIASDNDGNVTIGGTLTYADVTNVDSVGVITARSGLHVTGGSVGIGTDTPTNFGGSVKLALSDSGNSVLSIAAGTSSDSSILFADGTSGDSTYRGNIKYAHSDDSMRIHTAAEERLRVFSDGTIGIGTITSTIPVTPPTDLNDGNVPQLSPVLKIHRNNEHVSAGTSIGLLISDRVNRGTNAFNPLVLENAHNSGSDYSGSMIRARRYNHGGYDGTGFEINVGNGDGLFNLVGGAHYNPTDAKYSFDGTRGAAMIQFTDSGEQGVVRLWGSEGSGDPGIGVTFLQHYPPPTFYAHQTVSQTLNNGATVKATYTTEVFDTHSAYNTSNSTFTAPMSGYYWMHATLRIAAMVSDGRYDMTFRINGSTSVYSGGLNQQNTNDASTMATVIMDLNKGDTVEVYVDQNGGGNEPTNNNSNSGGTGMSHFTGYLVAPKFA